ncbi:MAG TPA: TetR/AcrR family transcriptional regulator [Terracidiphilus sp.]|nr:TetR/AcrR family transcriptional regulator [Terracidiphilus sp.]
MTQNDSKLADLATAPGESEPASPDRNLETRERILEAALKEFAAEGLAGARTDRIVAAAGVNKSSLFYYFGSKEKLYEAAVEKSAGQIRDSSLAVLLDDTATAGEKLMRAALNHFDRILSQHEFQSLMQQEMIRLHKGESKAAETIVKKVFVPVITIYQALVREGVGSGELVPLDWFQIHLGSLGANVFYFLSAPVWRMILDRDPFERTELEARRRGLLEFMGQAIFRDRNHGAELAVKVLGDSPMPEIPEDRKFFGRNL